MTTAPVDLVVVGETAAAPPALRRGPWSQLAAFPRLGTWGGLVVAGVGFGLIGLAWGRISDLRTVGLQTPYLVSAGLTGVGLIVVGVLIVAVDAKVSAARTQAARHAEIRVLVRELNGLLAARAAQEGVTTHAATPAQRRSRR